MSDEFPCFKCGMCCKNVHLSKHTIYLDGGKGICRYFDEENHGCKIYNQRPDICRVDLQYKLNYSELYTWDEFVAENLKVCNSLSMSGSERIKIVSPN